MLGLNFIYGFKICKTTKYILYLLVSIFHTILKKRRILVYKYKDT